ncbi:hypothetical protein [Candidatus Electronema sp. PJ]
MDEALSAGVHCSYDSFCIIAVCFGVALIVIVTLIAAFCFSEEKK